MADEIQFRRATTADVPVAGRNSTRWLALWTALQDGPQVVVCAVTEQHKMRSALISRVRYAGRGLRLTIRRVSTTEVLVELLS
jgi:hypothetical protein